VCDLIQDVRGEAAVRNAESALYEAMVAGDLGGLDRILSADLIYVHSTGVAENKAEYLARVQASHYDYDSIASRDVTVRVRGDLAVMNGSLDMSVATGGSPAVMMKLLFVLVWTKLDGQWRLSLRQSTNVGST
jgi:ketosteroid isomerase-like protein